MRGRSDRHRTERGSLVRRAADSLSPQLISSVTREKRRSVHRSFPSVTYGWPFAPLTAPNTAVQRSRMLHSAAHGHFNSMRPYATRRVVALTQASSGNREPPKDRVLEPPTWPKHAISQNATIAVNASDAVAPCMRLHARPSIATAYDAKSGAVLVAEMPGQNSSDLSLPIRRPDC